MRAWLARSRCCCARRRPDRTPPPGIAAPASGAARACGRPGRRRGTARSRGGPAATRQRAPPLRRPTSAAPPPPSLQGAPPRQGGRAAVRSRLRRRVNDGMGCHAAVVRRRGAECGHTACRPATREFALAARDIGDVLPSHARSSSSMRPVRQPRQQPLRFAMAATLEWQDAPAHNASSPAAPSSVSGGDGHRTCASSPCPPGNRGPGRCRDSCNQVVGHLDHRTLSGTGRRGRVELGPQLLVHRSPSGWLRRDGRLVDVLGDQRMAPQRLQRLPVGDAEHPRRDPRRGNQVCARRHTTSMVSSRISSTSAVRRVMPRGTAPAAGVGRYSASNASISSWRRCHQHAVVLHGRSRSAGTGARRPRLWFILCLGVDTGGLRRRFDGGTPAPMST